MLAESARLAAERRDGEQATRLAELAERLASAPDPATAQALDWAFFHELVEAARNVVLLLVMNTIRDLYLQRGELFQSVVADRDELAPLYARAARAVERGQAAAAARAVEELASAQERALTEALSAS